MQSTLFEIDNKAPRTRDTQRMYDDIRKAYHKLRGIKKRGVRLYTDEYILAEVAHQFYKQPRTIENIVFNRL
ncbi:hypothetical protein D3C72_344330 [compost metagenome]